MPYLGKTPSQATRKRYYLTASGGETSISGTMTTGGTLTFNDGEFVDVSVNGVSLVAGTDYNTTTANTIGGLSALTASDQVEIVVYDTFSVFGGNVDGDFTINNGTLTASTTSLDGAVTINESSADVDFRVESNGNANMLFVDAGNDRVGIGTNAPAHDVEIVATAAGSVNDSLQIRNNATSSGTGSRIRFINSTDNTSDANGASISSVRNGDDNDLVFETENATRMTIDHAGKVGIGTSSPAVEAHIQTSSGNPELRIESTGANYASLSLKNSSRTYSTQIRTDQSNAYVIRDETGGANRFLIDTSGNMMVGTTNLTPAQSNVSGGLAYRPTAQLEVNGNTTQAAFFGRTDDGEIIRFFSAGGFEGAITVSGSTVSYVGGHLSRWSQLADNTKDTSIVKGTVMTNLDQMAVWHHEAQAATYYEEGDELPEGVSVGDEKTAAVAAYNEDNEQLNCMAVSSVEGDANVAGVFVNWDNDDDDFTADMNIAMTGDMVIRIAQGTTVARGDLLMSAGDGTAKPQDDDIVRSKTIAKVTSTTVSHTYDDGSYLVPCVLMAC